MLDFFFLGFTMQFIVIMVSDRTSAEFILTLVMLPLTIPDLVDSDYAVTRELVRLTVLTTTCFFGGTSYVILKMVKLYTKYTSAYNVAVVPDESFAGR